VYRTLRSAPKFAGITDVFSGKKGIKGFPALFRGVQNTPNVAMVMRNILNKVLYS
jgi:hypothetical protein